jgi:hypothetical protein
VLAAEEGGGATKNTLEEGVKELAENMAVESEWYGIVMMVDD